MGDNQNSVLIKKVIRMSPPFFSVCMPVYNRRKTIFRALESVQNQDFRDFEVIIVDNKSSDCTVKEIERFFQSTLYSKNPFPYTFKENSKHLKGTEDWNKPLEFATGKYITILEGDDQFLPSHLKEAHKILSKNNSIGIYAVGNQEHSRPVIGLIDSRSYFRYTYMIEDVSPPSETIFIRYHLSRKYFYNAQEFHYCPEVNLYLEIANDKLAAYHSPLRTVFRDVTNKDKLHWRYLQDQFKVIKKWQKHKWVGDDLFNQAIRRYAKIAFYRYLSAKIKKEVASERIWTGIRAEMEQIDPEEYHRLNLEKIVFDSLIDAKMLNRQSVKYARILKDILARLKLFSSSSS